MSAIWKIGLFAKQAVGKAKCNACEKTIKISDGSTKALFTHANSHEEYAVKLKEIAQKQAAQKNTMEIFVKVLPKGELSSLDSKVVHLIPCGNLPFAIVEELTFKPLLSLTDRDDLKISR